MGFYQNYFAEQHELLQYFLNVHLFLNELLVRYRPFKPSFLLPPKNFINTTFWERVLSQKYTPLTNLKGCKYNFTLMINLF